MEESPNKSLKGWRIAAAIIVGAGAIVSVARMLYVGRRNESILLILMFVGWVLAPYIGWWVLDWKSKNWPVPARLRLYILMMVVTLMSVLIYLGAWSPSGVKPAFVFLVVPSVSLLVLVLILARAVYRRKM